MSGVQHGEGAEGDDPCACSLIVKCEHTGAGLPALLCSELWKIGGVCASATAYFRPAPLRTCRSQAAQRPESAIRRGARRAKSLISMILIARRAGKPPHTHARLQPGKPAAPGTAKRIASQMLGFEGDGG